MVGIRVEGASRLRTTLRKAGADMATLKAPGMAAAAIVVAEAKATSPRLSGALAGSIRAQSTVRGATVKSGTGKTGKVPYAGIVHYGDPNRDIEPRPWIAEAAKRTEPVWVPIYEAEMRKAIRQVKGK